MVSGEFLFALNFSGEDKTPCIDASGADDDDGDDDGDRGSIVSMQQRCSLG